MSDADLTKIAEDLVNGEEWGLVMGGSTAKFSHHRGLFHAVVTAEGKAIANFKDSSFRELIRVVTDEFAGP